VVTLLGRFIVDFVAPELRLVIEVDGAYHRSRHAADARRDRALVRAGYHVLRIDAELVVREGDVAATRVREAIEQVRGGGT
jgi:very-short-patch-repair endonuclease